MRKDKDLRALAIIAIFIAIIGLSIGYATLSETLRINTKTTLEGSNWQVEFQNLGTPTLTGGATITNAATLTSTLITIDVALKKPGDQVVYTFDVANNGDIDAKLSALPTISGVDEATLQHINYNLTYANGDSLSINDTLDVDEVRNLKLTVNFDANAEDIPSEDTVLNINTSLIYVQK